MLKKLKLKAIAFGLVVTVVINLIAGGIMGVAAVASHFTSADLKADPRFWAASFAVGVLTTVAGGFVAARTANQAPLANALGYGVVALALCVLLWTRNPLWVNISGLVTTVPLACLGGWLTTKPGTTKVQAS